MNHKVCILIVDDDQEPAKTLQDVIMVKGQKADAANSDSEAVENLLEAECEGNLIKRSRECSPIRAKIKNVDIM